MFNFNFSLLDDIQSGSFDGALSALYTSHNLSKARIRAIHAAEFFRNVFSSSTSAMLCSGPGRTEIGGNHTDHQHGHVLCGSVDMDMLACAAPNGQNTIHIHSEGYPALEVIVSSAWNWHKAHPNGYGEG